MDFRVARGGFCSLQVCLGGLWSLVPAAFSCRSTAGRPGCREVQKATFVCSVPRKNPLTESVFQKGRYSVAVVLKS